MIFESKRVRELQHKIKYLSETLETVTKQITAVPQGCKVGSWCANCKHGMMRQSAYFGFSEYPVCAFGSCTNYEAKNSKEVST